MTLAVAFWDSSAVIPLCVAEPASAHAKTLAFRFSLAIWWGCPVEAHGSFARMRRSGSLNSVNHLLALAELNQLERQWQTILPTDRLRDKAKELLDAYPLRAADSLQLASALIWCNEEPSGKTFICADIRLSEAAAKAGFSVTTP